MNGVIRPDVSAGSNQIGASDTWMPQVSCPCGEASAKLEEPATTAPAASANALRRVSEIVLQPGDIVPALPRRRTISLLLGSLCVEPRAQSSSRARPCPLGEAKKAFACPAAEESRRQPLLGTPDAQGVVSVEGDSQGGKDAAVAGHS